MVFASKKQREHSQGDNNRHTLELRRKQRLGRWRVEYDPQGGLDPQSGHQQRGPKLDIPSLQTKIPSQTGSVQFESTFSKSIMTQPSYIDGPSTKLLYTEPSFSRLAFTEPTYIEIPQPQAPYTLNHAPLMDLSAQIIFLVLAWRSLQWSMTHDFILWRI